MRWSCRTGRSVSRRCVKVSNPAEKSATIGAAIRAAGLPASETPLLDARLLMQEATGLDRADLIAEENRILTNDERAAFERLVARRRAGAPIAHILGRREFWSRDFEVAPGLLTPRPDTETLIEAALAARRRDEALRVLDLGTGTGVLLATLLLEFPEATGVGVDIASVAVETASRNLERFGLSGRGKAKLGDWDEGLAGRFDLVISNPPYIASAERGTLPAEVREHEDPRALFGGADGLDVYRRLAPAIARLLADDGLAILEIGAGQGPFVATIFSAFLDPARFGCRTDLEGRLRAFTIDQRLNAKITVEPGRRDA